MRASFDDKEEQSSGMFVINGNKLVPDSSMVVYSSRRVSQ